MTVCVFVCLKNKEMPEKDLKCLEAKKQKLNYRIQLNDRNIITVSIQH